MPDDLTPRITRTWDTAQIDGGGTVRNVTIVQFMIGRHGPYEEVFDRAPDKYAIQAAIDKRKASLEGFN